MGNEILVYVALDYNSQRENFDFAQRLDKEVDSHRFGFKINLDSIANFSHDALNPYFFTKQIKDLGRPVFVDMKIWNGGRTMENMAKGCAELGVDIINMYPHAGLNFMRRVHDSLAGSQTKLFGLTVLTHYTDEDTERLYGRNLKDSVKMLAKMSQDYGAEGIVVPGTQLNAVKDLSLLKLCPGIRPYWDDDKKANAQKQIITPEEAILQGADYLVIGSPIRNSQNPAEALERILEDIKVNF